MSAAAYATGAIDVVRGFYRALGGPIEDIFQFLDDDIVWATPSTLPWTIDESEGVYRGRDELDTYFASVARSVKDKGLPVAQG